MINATPPMWISGRVFSIASKDVSEYPRDSGRPTKAVDSTESSVTTQIVISLGIELSIDSGSLAEIISTI